MSEDQNQEGGNRALRAAAEFALPSSGERLAAQEKRIQELETEVRNLGNDLQEALIILFAYSERQLIGTEWERAQDLLQRRAIWSGKEEPNL
jgi:hypothetical protein